jgi:hypothetical protein
LDLRLRRGDPEDLAKELGEVFGVLKTDGVGDLRNGPGVLFQQLSRPL